MKLVKNLLLAGACAISILGTVACTGEAAKKDTLVIGVSLPTQREERWVRDRDAMIAAGKALGVEVKVAIADADMAQQATQVEQLLSQGIDVLIFAPHDGTAAASLVERVKSEGVPVIAYDRLILGTDQVDLYASFDNVKIGEMQGKFLAERVPEGNYIIMSGAPNDYCSALYKQGAMKYIQPLIDSGKVKVVADQAVMDWLPANAMTIVENALTSSENNVQAVLAPNDGTAGGALQAMEAQGLAGKVPITGQDAEVAAAKRIVAGTQSMTVFIDTRDLGKAAVESAIKLANGKTGKELANNVTNNETVDVPSLLLAAYEVTKDNLDKILIESGYMSKDAVYGTN